MHYELQLTTFKQKDGFKYKVIKITDITLHSNTKKPTKLIGKKIKQSFDSNQSGRIYTPINKTTILEQKNGVS